MEKNGYVIFSDDKIARIRIKRESSCGGNCSHCKGCGTDEVIIEAVNTKELKAGETVKVIMPDSSFVKKSLVGYGGLVFLILLGAISGYMIFGNELVALLFMVVFLFVGLFILKVLFKKNESDIIVERLD